MLNALLGYDRAIVAATPGTTRDVVDGTLVVEGVAVRVLDTAGLATPGDAIEAEGMERTRRAIAESDVILRLVDGSTPPPDDDALDETLKDRRVILVRSKSDLPVHPEAGCETALPVSVVTEGGVAELLTRLGREVQHLVGDAHDEGAVAVSVRQLAALERVESSLTSAADALGALPLEIGLVDLRDALDTISGLLGVEVGDAVLDRIFATFCVGK